MNIVSVKHTIGKDVNIKLLLTHNVKSLGFFDAMSENQEVGYTHETKTIIGYCSSRLVELEKTIRTDVFADKYIKKTSSNRSGVVYDESEEGVLIIYYVDNIRYIDSIVNNYTSYSATVKGLNNNNSIKKGIWYDESKNNAIFLPNITSDIDVERFKVNVVEPFVKIGYTYTLDDIYNFDGGMLYNVYKNE